MLPAVSRSRIRSAPSGVSFDDEHRGTAVKLTVLVSQASAGLGKSSTGLQKLLACWLFRGWRGVRIVAELVPRP